MEGKQTGVIIAAAFVAGFVGGIVSSGFLRDAPVFAQKGPQPEKVLQAERFEVVDQAGKVRAVLAVADSGALGLTLADQAGKTRAILGTLSDGTPHLGFLDRTGKARALLGTMPNGRMVLALLDKHGKALWQAP